MVKILASLSILNSSGASPSATEKVAALVTALVVPMDLPGACIVPLYKGKGDKCECSNSRGISLLSVVGELFGRVLIK